MRISSGSFSIDEMVLDAIVNGLIHGSIYGECGLIDVKHAIVRDVNSQDLYDGYKFRR